MDAESRSLGDFLSMVESNIGVFLTTSVEVDCRLFATCRLPLRPQGGEVPTSPIRTGEEEFLTLIA